MNQDYSYFIERLGKKTSLYNQVLNSIYNSYLENLQEGENPIRISFITSLLTYYIDWSAINGRDLFNLAANRDFFQYLKDVLQMDLEKSCKELFRECQQNIFVYHEDKGSIYYNRDLDSDDTFIYNKDNLDDDSEDYTGEIDLDIEDDNIEDDYESSENYVDKSISDIEQEFKKDKIKSCTESLLNIDNEKDNLEGFIKSVRDCIKSIETKL